jgi:hypothetical protein
LFMVSGLSIGVVSAVAVLRGGARVVWASGCAGLSWRVSPGRGRVGCVPVGHAPGGPPVGGCGLVVLFALESSLCDVLKREVQAEAASAARR